MEQISAKRVVWLMAGLFLLAACGSDKDKKNENSDMEMQQQMSETYVDTMVLHQTEFNKQIVCNGRLRAKAKSELNFTNQGIIATVCVKEGQHVSKGMLIATLDKLDKERDLERAEHELQKAKVELTDKLISLGYNDVSAVPAEVMQRAEVMSGYYSAKFQLQTAKKGLAECNLYAPFSGRIADLEAKKFQKNERLTDMIDGLNLAMLCLYPHDVYQKQLDEELDQLEGFEYHKANVRELKEYFDKINKCPIKDKVNIVLLMFPVKDKAEFVKNLHIKLWHAQQF